MLSAAQENSPMSVVHALDRVFGKKSSFSSQLAHCCVEAKYIFSLACITGALRD